MTANCPYWFKRRLSQINHSPFIVTFENEEVNNNIKGYANDCLKYRLCGFITQR